MAKSHAAKVRRAERRRKANPHGSTANPAMASAMAELRRSSAAMPHDGKSRSDRTRGARDKNAIRDSIAS